MAKIFPKVREDFPLVMTEQNWIESYEGLEIPHWAEDLTPSPLAEKLLKSLPSREGNRILEIGVGNGRDSIYFAQNGNQVTGVDLAPGAIRLAKTNSQRAGVADKVDFTVGRAEDLPFKDNTFDAVYSISVLHSTVLSESLKEVARVLKIGGKAMIYLYELTESGGRTYRFYPGEKVREIARENGLVVDGSRSSWDRRHVGEQTKILIFSMHKSSKRASK